MLHKRCSALDFDDECSRLAACQQVCSAAWLPNRRLRAMRISARLHEVPTRDLPKWVQKYFASTQFYDAMGDHWFLPFDGKDARYPARREAVATALQQGYHADDVARVWETSWLHRAPYSAWQTDQGLQGAMLKMSLPRWALWGNRLLVCYAHVPAMKIFRLPWWRFAPHAF